MLTKQRVPLETERFAESKNGRLKQQTAFQEFKLGPYQLHSHFTPAKIARLEAGRRKFVREHAESQMKALPSRAYYYTFITACYDRIFYSRNSSANTCPGPLRCNFPSNDGIKCAVASRPYEHRDLNSNMRLHFALNSGEFVESNGCSM